MFIVLPKAQATLARKALAKLEGYPVRGVTYGGEDRVSLTVPGPGWTTDAVDSGDDDGTTVCIELPDSLQKWLGQTVTIAGKSVTLPTADQLAADEQALPATLQAVRQAKRDAAKLQG